MYSPTNTFNWFEAKDVCRKYYGSSLASIHSSTDFTNLRSIAYSVYEYSWIGLNSILTNSDSVSQNLANWQYSDGTNVDYWYSDYYWDYYRNYTKFINNGKCARLYDYFMNFTQCDNRWRQFFCNPRKTWVPAMRIVNDDYNITYDDTDIEDYNYTNSSWGSSWYDINHTDSSFNIANNSYLYWIDGGSSFNSYSSESEYIESDFSLNCQDRGNNCANFRSVLMDHWSDLYNTYSSYTPQVKISLYSQNGTEMRYFIFPMTSDKISWMTQSNLIDSSYSDMRNVNTLNNVFWNIQGMSDINGYCIFSSYIHSNNNKHMKKKRNSQ